MLARAVDMMRAASDTTATAEPAAPYTKAAFCTLAKPSIQGAAAVVLLVIDHQEPPSFRSRISVRFPIRDTSTHGG